ncbi:MAG: hypothetical protein ACFE98_20185 [Candidatus Hermodarchaeota archaeon]
MKDFTKSRIYPLFISLVIFIGVFVIANLVWILEIANQVLLSTRLPYGNILRVISINVFFWLGFTTFITFKNYRDSKIKEYSVFTLLLLALLMQGVINLLVEVLPVLVQGGDLFQKFNAYTSFDFLTPYSIQEDLNGFSDDPFIQVINLINRYSILILINDYFIHVIFALYFMRGVWVTSPNKVKYTFIGLVIGSLSFKCLTFLIYPIYSSFTPNFVEDLILILGMFLFTLLLIYTYLYLGGKAFRSIDPPNPTPRIQKATVLWRINLLVLILWACILTLNYTGKVIEYSIFVLNRDLFHFSDTGYFFGFINVFDLHAEFRGGIYDVLWYLGNVMFILVPILLFTSVLILQGSIGFLYPEGQLIFESQIFRVKKAYDGLRADIKFQQSQLVHSPTFNAIANYLKQIPVDFFSAD